MSPQAESQTRRPRRAVVLTFDNLGEASELQRGTWPPGEPLGNHPSARVALPRLLEALDALKLSATFFVEAINCELYPDVLEEIAARGHELGHHGWRHEPWAQLSPRDEGTLLTRGSRAFAELGLDVRAFRPPGGKLTERTPALLRELGYRWCSPAGGAPIVREGLTFVPFSWDLVDAYHLMDSFSELRGGAPPLSPAALTRRLRETLGAEDEGAQALILHPFLMLDPGWWDGAQRVLALIASLAAAGRIWAGPGRQFAGRLRGDGAQ
jgi:peptidoglycan/xylan/chitin deacetylase (PgdA/CDA1 family)